jgi:hypothetical protein
LGRDELQAADRDQDAVHAQQQRARGPLLQVLSGACGYEHCGWRWREGDSAHLLPREIVAELLFCVYS